MRVTLFVCGPAANESELKAFEYLKTRLQSEPGEDEWVLLTNVAFSVTNQLQSDEIDIVAIGPPGAQVIEVKHWTAQWFDAHSTEVSDEADRVTNKARKIGTTLRKVIPELPRVDGSILLTQDPSKVRRLTSQPVRGVSLYTLNEWKAAAGLNAQPVLVAWQVKRLASAIQPRTAVALDGSLRRLAGYINLELQTAKDERFHRVYRASHPARRDRVMLHLYDLSASDDKNPEAKARREFEALLRLQLYTWAPRILDSYQEAPGYAGEMFFFTIVDPAAPSIEERKSDNSWTARNRAAFVRNTIRALAELHRSDSNETPIIHRNLTPRTILVKYDNTPILTGFERAKLPSEASLASSSLPSGSYLATVAPEVQAEGFAAADARSDVFSLCACLQDLFRDCDDEELSERAGRILERGLADEPSERAALSDLDAAFAELLGHALPPPEAPPARFWTEDQVVRFRDRDYRIVARLGSGGVGTTFKVIEIDRSTDEDQGTYVAKVAYSLETGRRALKAYSLVRSHLAREKALSTIFEVANEWQENQFLALMTWVSGAPLADFNGVFPLLAEEQQETSPEALALRWLRLICQALDVLHRNGLIHGDVSPRNLIVSGSDLVLTDYDFVSKIGEALEGPGTVVYCSPSYQEKRPASASDDIYALAATFFHVIFEREPFQYGGQLEKKRGLNWEGLDTKDYPVLRQFLDKATHPEPTSRFANVADAVAALQANQTSTPPTVLSPAPEPFGAAGPTVVTQEPELREQRVEWLHDLLQSYPGSPWGNRETRGLDTDFAAHTYVETAVEETLVRDIFERRVRLVVLCGNAGDGKTALLQHLANRLGFGQHQSSERILEGRLPDGLVVRMNLDGSASWKGRSADEILDEFLKPFEDGEPTEDLTHLLAINDGRLLEWIEKRNEGDRTALAADLYQLLQTQAAIQKSYIRFINLNQRSLVGQINDTREKIEATFLDRLIDSLYGGPRAAEIWSPCRLCSAKPRCEVYRASHLFGPVAIADCADERARRRARDRLFEALQAVHLRGEAHITMRELRSALVYILFGIHFCDDYHTVTQTEILPYWDRAFAPDSPARQGEVLTELVRFDPALEAHPQIDRYLLSTPSVDDRDAPPHYPDLSLPSARRRAFFEWTERDLQKVAIEPNALDLAKGRHLRRFRNLPIADDRELAEVCKLLCRGIARLEDLPPQALERIGVVPLRVTPRTPTETAFWVEKPLDAFRLEAEFPAGVQGIEWLHRQAVLIYRYRNGRDEERLRLGAELFHLLLELADGYQLGDVSTDDTFANLSIFVQRLVREDERTLLAWNPMQDEAIYRVSAEVGPTANGARQRMVITRLESGVGQ
jgi:serine/threonine protein kinase